MNVITIRIQTADQHHAGEPIIPGNPPADDATESLYVIRKGITMSGQSTLCICVKNPLHPNHWIVTELTGQNLEGLMVAFRANNPGKEAGRS